MRMTAVARLRKEICQDLAYVDKLPKIYKSVKYLLIRQDLFDRTIEAKAKKTKDSEETVRAFSTMITKKNRPNLFGPTKEQNLLESLKSLQR